MKAESRVPKILDKKKERVFSRSTFSALEKLVVPFAGHRPAAVAVTAEFYKAKGVEINKVTPEMITADIEAIKASIIKISEETGTAKTKPQEHQSIITFVSDDDRKKFRNKFGIDAYPRKAVRAKHGPGPVTYDEVRDTALAAEEFLTKLLNEKAEGPKVPCVQGDKCVNPKFTFVPFGAAKLDWSNPLEPKHAVLKVWDGEELVTLLKLNDKVYHAFADGRVSKKDRGETVFVSSDETKMVLAEGKPILLYVGRFFVDYQSKKVDGPLCFLCEAADVEKHGKKDAIRLTSKAAAEADLARFIAQEEANKEYQAQREARAQERAKETGVAIEDLHSRTRKPTYFSSASRKTQWQERPGRK